PQCPRPAPLLSPHHPPPSSTLFPYTTLFRSTVACPLTPHAVHASVSRASSSARPTNGARRDADARASASRPAFGSRQARSSRTRDRKSTRLNSSHDQTSYAVFCLKKKTHAL